MLRLRQACALRIALSVSLTLGAAATTLTAILPARSRAFEDRAAFRASTTARCRQVALPHRKKLTDYKRVKPLNARDIKKAVGSNLIFLRTLFKVPSEFGKKIQENMEEA